MKRTIAIVVVAACGSHGGGGGDDGKEGIELTRVSREVSHDHGKDEHYLAITMDMMIAKPLADDEQIDIRAACQVGPYRFVDRSPFMFGLRDDPGRDKFRYGAHNTVDDQPYLIHPLPGKPSMCDIAFLRHGYQPKDHTDELARFCATDHIARGACPPNPAHPPPSGPPVTADELHLTRSPANDLFPASTTFTYVFTAQADMKPYTNVHIVASCAGAGGDLHDTALENLHAGESTTEAENIVQGDLPDGTPCDVSFRYAQIGGDEVGVEFAHFCATVGGGATRGTCGS